MKDNQGSFGVAVGTSAWELYSIEGPAPGYPEHSNSFRSEAYGMLAGFSFLLIFIKTHAIQIPPNRKFYAYCDNLSLLENVQNILTNKTFSQMYIRSKADVLLQIAQDVQRPSITWDYGYLRPC
jgi:hypothetical protein